MNKNFVFIITKKKIEKKLYLNKNIIIYLFLDIFI